MSHQQLVILYHAKCADGFGGAYAAWKKYGDSAEYIPVSYGKPIPEHLSGRDIIFVDFCYEQPVMDELAKIAKSITVLDHHAGVREVATKFPGVFDPTHSGATIAWKYFHPDEPVPKLLLYLEDGDLYLHKLPETRDIFSYLMVAPYDFLQWDELVNTLENDTPGRDLFMAKARNYNEYFKLLAESAITSAKLVEFEGHQCYFANSHPNMTMKSYIGNQLVKKLPPIALIVAAHPEGFGVSIRGDGSVDVAEIARKFGGNGHPSSAGFLIPAGGPLPWKEVETEATS